MNLGALILIISSLSMAGACKQRGVPEFKRPLAKAGAQAPQDQNEAEKLKNPTQPGEKSTGGEGGEDHSPAGDRPTTETPPPVNSGATLRVVGYQPSWAGTADSIQYDKLTHIIYAFLIPTESGGHTALDQPAKLRAIVQKARASKAKPKVLLAIGGWGGTDAQHRAILRAFQKITGNTVIGNTFIAKLMALVDEYGLDGIDLDWEYPRKNEDGANLANFAARLSAKLKAKGKILTAAVYAAGATGDGITAASFPHYEFINVMSYDEESEGHHASMDFFKKSLTYWHNQRGLAKNKINLGVPFYGRAAPKSLKYKVSQTYRQIIAKDAAKQWGNSISHYYAAQRKNVTIYYDGRNEITKKVAYARQQNVGGIMIWELSQDAPGAPSLLSAIANSSP